MKIGILTYHAYPNFGANLQAFSTVGYLQKKGYTPIVINWIPESLEQKAEKVIPEIQIRAHSLFCEQHLPMTELCRTTTDVEAIIEKNGIDILFIGSDALWNYTPMQRRRVFSYHRLKYIDLPPTLDHDYPNPFWGCFSGYSKTIPKVAFSVSSQNTPYYLVEGTLKEDIRQSLLTFNHITVRDEWTKHLVEYFTNKAISPEVTPDPVFAFNANVPATTSKEDIVRKFGLNEKYILFSFLHPKFDAEWASKFSKICSDNDYQCVALTFPEKLIDFGIKKQIAHPLDTLDWYYLIKYSSGYVGERMHPIITSLHNVVPFFVFDDYGLSHGNKLKDLLFPINSQKVLESSKIYDILKKANLLENYYSYKMMKRIPNPEKVFEKIQKFDKVTCQKFYELQLSNYTNNMNIICNNIFE